MAVLGGGCSDVFEFGCCDVVTVDFLFAVLDVCEVLLGDVVLEREERGVVCDCGRDWVFCCCVSGALLMLAGGAPRHALVELSVLTAAGWRT